MSSLAALPQDQAWVFDMMGLVKEVEACNLPSKFQPHFQKLSQACPSSVGCVVD